jgi:hypothetical protein
MVWITPQCVCRDGVTCEQFPTRPETLDDIDWSERSACHYAYRRKALLELIELTEEYGLYEKELLSYSDDS